MFISMKRIIILSGVICILLSGCGVRIAMSDEDMNMESSVGIFNTYTSYFDRYSIDKEEDCVEAKGRLHQAADDDNSIITYLTAEDKDGSVNITGNMDCSRGSLRLGIYGTGRNRNADCRGYRQKDRYADRGSGR